MSDEQRQKPANLVRLNINMTNETADQLKRLCEQRGLSYTEAVRRAVAVYSFIDSEARAGRSILIRDGIETKELVLL